MAAVAFDLLCQIVSPMDLSFRRHETPLQHNEFFFSASIKIMKY
jgi:hypothetical protein